MTAGDTTNAPQAARGPAQAQASAQPQARTRADAPGQAQNPAGGQPAGGGRPGANAAGQPERLESIRPFLPREFAAKLVEQLTVGSHPQVVDVVSPLTGETIVELPQSGPGDVRPRSTRPARRRPRGPRGRSPSAPRCCDGCRTWWSTTASS